MPRKVSRSRKQVVRRSKRTMRKSRSNRRRSMKGGTAHGCGARKSQGGGGKHKTNGNHGNHGNHGHNGGGGCGPHPAKKGNN